MCQLNFCKYFNEQCPNYWNEVFDVAKESNFQKLKRPFRKINNGQYALSYIGPTFWNETPYILKRSSNLNTFKRNFKKYFLKELKDYNNSFKISFQFLTMSILIFLYLF